METRFTWGDIKLSAMKKADPSLTTLVKTRNTRDYFNTAVDVANRGLQDLATTGKMLIKKYYIMIPEIRNLIENDHRIFQHYSEDVSYSAKSGYSYYFEISGEGIVEIKVGNELIDRIENDSKAGFKKYKGVVNNPEEKEITIVFTGEYPYQYRNAAIYSQKFKEAEDIWEYSEKCRFDLRELTDDFYMLQSQDVVKMSNEMPYVKCDSYEWEGDGTLVLNGTAPGNYIVHYYAYPQRLTEKTPDTFILPLDPEVANILPLYMASQFIEEDDPSQSYYIREQYEEAKAQLKATVQKGKPNFIDVRGW